jgi:putative sigma-54 modulation protein
MKASIDLLVEKLERQARRYRDKRRRGHGRGNHEQPVEGIPVVPDEETPVIVKTKQFAVKPMTPEEAVLQLELVGHDFFVFQNADTNDVNVVYRRRDGNYGLIEPQVT